MKKTTSWWRSCAALSLAVGLQAGGQAATTPLADQPILVADVPANVMLALSVEFPTAITRAYTSTTFDPAVRYIGYFVPEKCYDYVTQGGVSYFTPSGALVSAGSCGGRWSGNFMNWATMQGADTFRWVLTGGNRLIDEPQDFAHAPSSAPFGRTVLQRAYASTQGSYLTTNFPDRILAQADVDKYTGLGSPYNTGAVWIRNGGMGTQVRFGQVKVTTTTTTSHGRTTTTTTTTNPWTWNSQSSCDSGVACALWNVNVEVCRDDSTGAASSEANCVAYKDSTGTKTVYKPVGLMQRNKGKMYFGAFGYLALNSDPTTDASGVANNQKDGGVLRSKVQSIDDEISETGYFYTNPYGATDVTNSGTINYLNKFGLNSQGYKYYDPVSELYAEVIKYFKHLSPTGSYVSGLNSALKDGFPVITNWNDPAADAKYPNSGPLACKKNYVIGIGDTNTNYDWNLSGSTYSNPSRSPIAPADVDSAMGTFQTAKAWSDEVGRLEGISSLGTRRSNAGADGNGSYLIAGLAYYAHSSDLRSDLSGTQTVSTYWMDVMENGYIDKNQYWLAAKYGGYVKQNGSIGQFSSGDYWNRAGNKFGTYDLPDNYYTANSPDKMKAGLESAFQSIAAGSGAATGAALSASTVSATAGGANTYQSYYDAALWTGDIKAVQVNSVDPSLALSAQSQSTALWSAAAKLDALGSGGRKIVTLAPTDRTLVSPTPANLAATPFLWANLSSTQQLNLSKTAAVPAGDATDGQRILNYLRGDRTYESTASTSNLYRQRGGLLGDIVDSKVVYLGDPEASYSDSANPGYSTFKTANTGRRPMIFVGANDGMFHAFDAGTSSNAGNEVMAVVPYSLYAGPDANPEVSGIQALARKTYAHRYYMDATAEIRDVDFARTGGKLSSFSSSLAADWRSLLVVGQGKGGRSFIAMDVTNFTTLPSTESAAAGKVLWEYTHADMGFSFGRPLIAKTRRWGWVVILTGGYNNTSGGRAGQGALFILNARTGALLGSTPVYTGSGSQTSPSGFAQIEGYTPSYQDYTLDYVYGGDLDGKLWRFNFTSETQDLPPVEQIAEFSVGGVGQPITTAPKIEYSADDLKRYVFVGTGRLLATEDQNNTQQQTMYAVRDGTRSMAFGSESNQAAFPAGFSAFPVRRGNLVQVTDLLAGASLSASTPMGWYYDLTGTQMQTINGANTLVSRERVVFSLQANDGVLTWVGTIMTNDPCSASVTGTLYSVHYGSGQSVLTALNAQGLSSTVPYLAGISGLTDTTLIRFRTSTGQSIRILGTDVTGSSKLYGSSISEAGEPRVVNWRIIRE